MIVEVNKNYVHNCDNVYEIVIVVYVLLSKQL